MRKTRRPLFGLEIDPLTMDETIDLCRNALQTRERLLIGVLNAAKVVSLGKDDLLRESILECDVLLADGQSLVWAGRLLGRPLPERVTGVDLFERLLDVAAREDRSVYLLGARPEVISTLQTVLPARFPGLRIAGARDGYFADDEAAAVAKDIRRSGADMLFLGMTSPKKEIFLKTYGSGLGVPVLHGVGGSFDIFAGVTKRAPLSWQRLGLEWAYRLVQEPRRMWRRYLTTNSAFVVQTLRERLRPRPLYRRPVPVPPQVIDLRDGRPPNVVVTTDDDAVTTDDDAVTLPTPAADSSIRRR